MPTLRVAPIALMTAALTFAAGAQTATCNWEVPAPTDLPAWIARDLADHDNKDGLNAYRNVKRERKDLIREFNRLKREYFRAHKNVEMRQLGISKLREYTDPETYPALLEVFRRDHEEVRGAILDMLADQQTDEADSALCWAAIFDKDESFRAQALERLAERAEKNKGASERIVYIVAEAIKRPNNDVRGAAAKVADLLNITQVIPHLIAAQAGPSRSGGSGSDGDKGWIMIGRQIGFVSDLQPVVADSAVAFDPQLDVLTEGVLIRVTDASVITYHTEVHSALLGLAERSWGQDLDYLGYDRDRWARWYVDEYTPAMDARKAAAEAQQAADQAAASADATRGG